MMSKVIGVFLLGMLRASAESEEAMQIGKAMGKFMPGASMARPGVAGGALSSQQSSGPMQSAVLQALADVEERNREMKIAYQHLRARIQKMPQADNQASPSSAASFGWLAGFIASFGLVTSAAFAAVRKTSGHGQRESELTGQRAGLITASAADGLARSGDVKMTAISPGDIGTTKPLGVYDPLGLMTKNPEKYRRFQEMEIKHGRIAMLATLHVVVTANFKWDGYCSYLSFPPLKFADIPAGTLASWETLPQAGWAQIVALIAILDNSLFRQEPDQEPGNVVTGRNGEDRIPWVRYSDPKVREFKLNAERNNGRAAMMGIIGMMIHEQLTGNPIFPLNFVDRA